MKVQITDEARISEWGNPIRAKAVLSVRKYIAYGGDTWGTETSKYPQEEKTKCDSVSSGERTRKSPNRGAEMFSGVWTGKVITDERECGRKAAAKEGESPVPREVVMPVSGVPRDTRNLVGKWEDHLLRLNTTR